MDSAKTDNVPQPDLVAQLKGKAPPPARRIFLWNMSQFANLLSPLAALLREQHGIETILLTISRARLPDPKFFNFKAENFEEIIDLDSMMAPRPMSEIPEPDELARQVNEFENRLGIHLTELIRTDRHVGMGFVTGAKFSRSQYIALLGDHSRTLDMTLRLCQYFETLFSTYQPIAMMMRSGMLPTACLISVGEKMGVPMRALIPSRRGKMFYWASDKFAWPDNLDAKFKAQFAHLLAQSDDDKATQPETEQLVKIAPPARAQIVFSEIGKRARVRHMLTELLKVTYRMLRDGQRRHQRVYGKYIYRDVMASVVERHFWTRRTLRETPLFPSLPANFPFVFYPLSREPEATLMVESPTCDNQLSFIDWLSKTVPSGCYIIVKEHPAATSPRPTGFWEQVHKYPNVRVAATLEDSADIIPRAATVAVINSTAGIQAALIGKPVITFSPYFIGRAMPHVLYANSFEATRQAFLTIQGNDFVDKATRMIAAQAYLEAVEIGEFPLNDPNLQRGVPAREPIDPAEIELLAETLVKSLDSNP